MKDRNTKRATEEEYKKAQAKLERESKYKYNLENKKFVKKDDSGAVKNEQKA